MPDTSPRFIAGLSIAALLGLTGCGDAFRIAGTAPETLPDTYVSTQYGASGGDTYSEFRAGRIGCPELARRGWSSADRFAVGCPAD